MKVHRTFDSVGLAKVADPLVLINHMAFAKCVSQCWKIPPCSASSSHSCGDLSLFSFTEQGDFCICVFSCTGAADTSMGWFSGPGAVPVTGVRVAAVPVLLSSDPETSSPVRVMNKVEEDPVGLGQTPACCNHLCLEQPGHQHTFSRCFTSFSTICTCSRVKFQCTGGSHCPGHLPMLSHCSGLAWMDSRLPPKPFSHSPPQLESNKRFMSWDENESDHSWNIVTDKTGQN